MSGHSKWSKIKRKKGAADARRGQTYTKVGRMITVAAREGGGDPDTNFQLRLALDKAKAANMPSDNIEKAIKRGTGEDKEGGELFEVSYEGFGPGKVPVIVDCTTDNKNRTVAALRKFFEKNGGTLSESGTVAWQFEERGLVSVICEKAKEAEKFGKEAGWEECDPEEVTLELMEVEGVVDIEQTSIEDEDGVEHEGLEVITGKEKLAAVVKAIEEMQYRVVSAEIVKIAKNPMEVGGDVKGKLEEFVEGLEELDEVDSVWAAEM